MEMKIAGPNDLLWAIAEVLPEASILSQNTGSGLDLGTESWLGVKPEMIRQFASRVFDVIRKFGQSRPSAEITIGDVSIKLGNVSEELICSAIDRAIEASGKR